MSSRKFTPLMRPVAVPREVELVVDASPPRRVSMVSVRHDDKSLFDGVQDYLSWREGRRLTQWDVFTIVLAEAAEKEGGVVAAALGRPRG